MDRRAQKAELKARSATLDARRKSGRPTQEELDHKLKEEELDYKKELDPPKGLDIETRETPYVDLFHIPNVFQHYLNEHPPPKPWSFGMNPASRPKERPILDPFKWSTTFVHPWGEKKTKDPETIRAEECLRLKKAERLAKKYIRPCEPEQHHHKRVSVYCQPNREPVYKLDIYGNPKLGESGNPIYEPIYMLNSQGKILLDGVGDPIPVYILDKEGNVELDVEGKPIAAPTYMLDAQGNALLDQAGNLVPEPADTDLLDANGKLVLDEYGHPRNRANPVYMLDAEGHVMLDQEGNKILGRSYRDLEGNVVMDATGQPVSGRFQFGVLDKEGHLCFDSEGSVFLDAEGAPLLERQETTEEKKFRLALEEQGQKAKMFQEKLRKDRIMMLSPLPKKRAPWKKYCTNMSLPRNLRTAVYKDRGGPGDDWRKCVKKYTIAEMNHRVAVQLHGKTGAIWRNLHKHVTYLQNPRYVADIKQFDALRIFRLRESGGANRYDLVELHQLIFDGFEPGKTYVQHLRIYNASPWTQRIRVVKPGTPVFSITSTEEEFQGKNLVPGHKCDFDVLFQPHTAFLYKDVITLKTEMQVLPLKLEAINPYPVVVLPTIIDMGVCLSGHSVSYQYTLTSKGAGAEFSLEAYETSFDCHQAIKDPRYDDLKWEYDKKNMQYLPPFLVYPRVFRTTADSKQEFVVLFRPPRVGVYHDIVQLRTGTDLHWEIKIKGTAADLKFNLQKLEGKDFLPGQVDLGVNFGQVTVSHNGVKEITVRSQTAIPLRFQWSMQPKHVDLSTEDDKEHSWKARQPATDKLDVFTADPDIGVFAAESETAIKFTFTPPDLANYHQVACLYVDTRVKFPLTSYVWRDFRERLWLVETPKAERLADGKSNQRVLWGIQKTGFECSDQILGQANLMGEGDVTHTDKIFHVSDIDNLGTIFRIAEIDLVGSGTQFDVEIVPRVYQFSGILTLGQTHLGNIELVNNSPTCIMFTWDCPKNPYGVLMNGANVFPRNGTVGPTSTQKVKVTINARKVGRIELELHCLIESPYKKGQLPLSLKLEGHVVGPTVVLSPPILDFGLCQIDSTYSMLMNLTNTSKHADATFKLYSTRDSQVSFFSPLLPRSQMTPSLVNPNVHVVNDDLSQKPVDSLVTLLPGISQRAIRPLFAAARCNGQSEPSMSSQLVPTLNAQAPADPSPPTREGQKTPKSTSQPLEVLGEPSHSLNSKDPPLSLGLPQDPHASCAPYHRVPIYIPTLDPLDKEICPEFIPAPNERVGISKGYGEILQVFNDGITNPKLPPTTLFLPPLQPLAFLHPLAYTIEEQSPEGSDKMTILPVIGEMGKTKLPVPSLVDETETKLKQPFGSPSCRHQAPPLIQASIHGRNPLLNEGTAVDAMHHPTSPPIVKTSDCIEAYKGDLSQTLMFEPVEGIVPKGNKSLTITVTIKGTICGLMQLFIVCEICNGLSPTQHAIARANIEAPEACLTPCFIDLKTKFLNIPITINIVMRNLKSLPAYFSWPKGDRVGNVEDLDVELIEQSGEIPPGLERPVIVNLIPRKLGPLQTILICNVMKMINPLGLKLEAVIVDTRISYHLFRPNREDGHQKPGRKLVHERILLKRQQMALGNPVQVEEPDNWFDPKIPCIDFGKRRPLGRAHCLKLVLQNHSPIEVNVQLIVGKYQTEPLAALLKDECWVISSLTERLSYLIPTRRDPFQSALEQRKGDHNSQFHFNFPSLTDLSDIHLKYFSQLGKQKLWRRAEGAMHEALIKEGMPLAFLCYPSCTGVIKPWSDWSVEVVCFSNLPGNYTDILTCKVGRLDPVDLVMEVEIIGTPLVARRNWLEPTGLQQPDNEGEVKLAWQPMPVKNTPIKRQFWVQNNSPFHIELMWELKKQSTSEEGKLVSMNLVIEEDILTHAMVTGQPEWYGIEPTTHVTIKEHIGVGYQQHVYCIFKDYLEDFTPKDHLDIAPFIIHPQKQVIPGHTSRPFEVTFYATDIQSYAYILAGYHRIYDGKSSEHGPSTPLVFDSTLDQTNEQYVYRKPEEKHVCEHVVTFYSKKDDFFSHTVVHKTTIMEPSNPKVLDLHMENNGIRAKHLSRYHYSNNSDSSSSSDGGVIGAITSKRPMQRKSMVNVLKNQKYTDDWKEREFMEGPLEGRAYHAKTDDDGPERAQDRKYSKVHDLAYQSESKEEESKYQFNIRRRSSRQRRISIGLAVNFKEEFEANLAEGYNGLTTSDLTTLSNPQLDISEIIGTNHCKDLHTFAAFRPLRVSLEAVLLLPRLRTNVDDSLFERLSFQCFGNDLHDKRFDVHALHLTNIYAHSIEFNVYIPTSFEILSIRHGVLEPYKDGGTCQRMSIFKSKMNHFILKAGHTLQFNISFKPMVDDCVLDPKDIIIDSELRIQFLSNHDQIIRLHAELLFPELQVMTENLHFGNVVIATTTQARDFTLSNQSLPNAHWRIVTEENHLQTIALAASGTPPKWDEFEGLGKTWPMIWSAHPERGVVQGRKMNELGESNEIQCYKNKSIVTVSFSPLDKMNYKQVLWVEVHSGRGCRLTLEGTGIDECPDELSIPPLIPPVEQKGKEKRKEKKKGVTSNKGKK